MSKHILTVDKRLAVSSIVIPMILHNQGMRYLGHRMDVEAVSNTDGEFVVSYAYSDIDPERSDDDLSTIRMLHKSHYSMMWDDIYEVGEL
jgi:hypothetical protein